ncbi:MAG: phosphate/phosphite/phosphonate ABC transporter substrate-binding protein [Gammaproteobacteria bacterium]|nr:phosphate/phosphite/phosphonate ABC transporter substrate-binding protein [Gammaproteobacteria bacterium]MBT3722209.1 phosphate/phosphite/phosphonate ABC transporter substrate-binding protein [Gammaproteobacteria bacterium]MBT4193526.1 phosphate/phosphite/phosphonate ABC transporter substrate-binding protein [Gammaproteobacteria bacterium]MBT4452187.1 phosphate/phosphite/phosphonate ABC transporter substrate-binding protein [Gammaproteobacteria bacterium]MBT4861504.1 phosphate/phosphite/phos
MYSRLIALLLSIIIPLSIIATFPTTALAQEKTFIFGIIPQFEAKKLRSIWQPIINYLKTETGYNFKIKGSPTIPDFESEIMQGDFDFVYLNPYQSMLANETLGYTPLVKDIEKTLFGIIVVKKDSSITDVSQLDRQVIAFPAPNALAASLLVRKDLQDDLKIKVYPRYVKTHDSVYLNVLLGEVAAGGGVQKTLSQQQPKYQAALKVIYKTREVSPHPVSSHPRVPINVVNAVKNALLKLGETTEGKNLLAKIPMKKIGEASLMDYLSFKELGLERFYNK